MKASQLKMEKVGVPVNERLNEINADLAISVRGVGRSFRSIEKGEGLRGSLELLFRPKYKVHQALEDVSFSIERGSFVGLIGANGAGKTTLLKILSGLIPSTQGEARVLGVNPFHRPLEFRKRISLVMGQKAQLWWDLPGLDAFELLRAIYQIPRDVYKQRLHDLSEMLGVEKLLGTQIRRLSLGERMKMELIGALLHWPDVVFLDEPTIGLDVVAAQNLREFLKSYNLTRRSTLILTSHNMDDIEKLCSRVIILKEGKMVFDGSPKKLMGKGEKRLRVRLPVVPSLEELARVTGIAAENIAVGGAPSGGDEAEEDEDVSKQMVRFRLLPAQMPSVLQALMGAYQIVDMGVEEQSLEDVIQRLFSGVESYHHG